MKDFRQLNVWETSHQLALTVYKATKEFPKEELHGLTSQIHRAGMSIPTNIAEGCGRNTDADFARFLHQPAKQNINSSFHTILAFSTKNNTTNSIQMSQRSNVCSPRSSKR